MNHLKRDYLFNKTLPVQESQYKMPISLFTILKSALWEYYNTVESKVASGSGDFAIINYKHVTLVTSSDSDYISNYYACIINFQSFIEQYIVSILENIHPVIVKGGMNELDILNAATWNFDVEEYKSKNTLNFNLIIKRLEFMITNSANLPEKLRVIPEFHFLAKHVNIIEGFKRFAERGFNKGSKILNR